MVTVCTECLSLILTALQPILALQGSGRCHWNAQKEWMGRGGHSLTYFAQVDYPEPPKSRYNTEGFGRDDDRNGNRGGSGRGRGRGHRDGGKRGDYSRHGGANKQRRPASEFERFG